MAVWSKFFPNFIGHRVERNPYLQKILGNTGWVFIDKIARRFIGLLVGILLARHFGPELYGKYSYAVAFVLILSPIATLSLDAISVRQIVQKPDSSKGTLGTSFILMTCAGLVAFTLAFAGIFIMRPQDELIHWLVGILAAGTLLQGFMVIEFWFFSQVQSKFIVLARTSAFLLLSTIKIILILNDAPLITVAWASLADIILGAIGLVVVYRWKGFSLINWRFSLNLARSMLKDSWPLILSAFLTLIYLRIDQIMLGNMVGSAELGQYSLAVQFSEVWNFVPMVLCGSVFPAILEAEAYSEELFYSRLQRLYGMVTILSYIFAIPVTIFSDEIIAILFGPAFSESGYLLAILVWTGLFTSLGAARNLFVLAKNWTRINLISIALGCSLNIVLNLIFIPKYGAMGAVIATFASYWFTVHGSCFLFKSLRKTGWMMTKAMIYPKILDKNLG